MIVIEFETERLRLRQWREADREPFAALNADPKVMEYFPALISRPASDASIDAWQSQFAERGWSNWAVELLETGESAGFVGLTIPRRVLPFSPFTTAGNSTSRAVMERIGVCNANEDFEHPDIPEGSPLRLQCLYRLTRERWSAQ